MDFLTSVRLLLKRWYVVVPMLGLTVAASLATAKSIQPSYQFSATLVLLVPSGKPSQFDEVQSDQTISNPYLEFTNSLKVAAEIVSVVMTSDSMKRRMWDSGMSRDYEVVPTTPISAAPILTITVTSRNEEVARQTRNAIVRTLRAELQQIQASAGATTSSRIQVQVASAPTRAKRVVGSTVRAVAVALVLGLAATFSAACLVNFMAERRRARRGRRLRGRGRLQRSADTGPLITIKESTGGAQASSYPSADDRPVIDNSRTV